MSTLPGEPVTGIPSDSGVIFTVTVTTNESSPETFSLFPNYPNPFNPRTTVKYRIDEKQKVLLQVFDVTGRMVATLEDGIREPGEYEVSFDAGNLASGLYMARLSAGHQQISRKMLLVR